MKLKADLGQQENSGENEVVAAKATPITMAQFLQSVSPGKRTEITDLAIQSSTSYNTLNTPNIFLYCDDPLCGGVRTFASATRTQITTTPFNQFLFYTCQNCKTNKKTYSLRCEAEDGWIATKFGELPSFGPPIPPKAITLVRGDRALFMKGRNCEFQGLGIAAFTYYRRVIEGQKHRIFDEIIKVLQATDPANEIIAEVRAAKSEIKFSASVDAIKHGLPASLQINGRDPLRLLHSALSEGVHALTDDDCLKLATAVRTVLIEFSERLSQALNDNEELARSVALLSKKSL